MLPRTISASTSEFGVLGHRRGGFPDHGFFPAKSELAILGHDEIVEVLVQHGGMRLQVVASGEAWMPVRLVEPLFEHRARSAALLFVFGFRDPHILLNDHSQMFAQDKKTEQY